MGVIVSYFRGAEGRTDDPDPVTGLTSRDKYVLSTTWKRISDRQANLETGMSIFLRFFEKHPEYQQLFPFRDIPRDQLKSNSKFRAHCISLMYALASIVDNIDNPPVLEELLAKQGVSHVPRKVPNHAYWELKETLLELFAKAMNEEEVKTWDTFLDMGFKTMGKNAEEVKKY